MHGGCRVLLDVKDSNNRCKRHRKKNDKNYNQNVRWNSDNKKFAEFYASNEWRKLRNKYFNEIVVCEVCLESGRIVIGEIVHHKDYEVREDFSKRFDWDNLQLVCRKCHNRIHNEKGED